jgi:aryl-alcohol dehydrogenase-like predicted oxidoreductase
LDDTDRGDSVRVIHGVLDAGSNVIDAADVFFEAGSEKTVGRAVTRERRDNARR